VQQYFACNSFVSNILPGKAEITSAQLFAAEQFTSAAKKKYCRVSCLLQLSNGLSEWMGVLFDRWNR
jgi:hypothetical protein